MFSEYILIYIYGSLMGLLWSNKCKHLRMILQENDVVLNFESKPVKSAKSVLFKMNDENQVPGFAKSKTSYIPYLIKHL